jgi:hypothetical protein
LGVVPVEDQDFLWGHHAHVGLGNEPPRFLQALGVGGGVFEAAEEAELREDQGLLPSGTQGKRGEA